MILYNINFSSVTLSTSNDVLTIISQATRSFMILEIDIGGMGNTSAANEIAIYRVTTAGTTGASAITPAPLNPASPAFGGVVNGGWTTQPTVGAKLHTFELNSNGQRYFWRWAPGQNPITAPGGANAAGSLSLRSVNGTGVVSGRIQIAEL